MICTYDICIDEKSEDLECENPKVGYVTYLDFCPISKIYLIFCFFYHSGLLSIFFINIITVINF